MKKNILICILILCSIEMWAQMSLPSVLVMKQNTYGLHSPAGGKDFYLIAIATEANPAVDKFEMHIRMIDLQQMVMYNAQSFSTYTKIDPLGLTYVFDKRRLILLESDSPFEHINNTPLIYLDTFCRSNYNGYIVFHDSEQYISLCNFPISTTVCHNVLAGGISPTGPTWFLKGIVAGSEVQDPCHKVKKLSLSESDKYDLYKKIGLVGNEATFSVYQITTPFQDKSKQTIC